MRIEIKPPPGAPLRPGALVTLRVEAADPAPLLSGPPSVAYEGRYTASPAPALLFPAPGPQGVSMRTSAASDFRSPLPTALQAHVDIPVHEGDTITAVLTTPPPDSKTYTAAIAAPAAPNRTPVVLTLAAGPQGPTPPGPNPPPSPQPAEGLTITPVPAAALPPPLEEGDVVRLDTAPGADNLIVLVPA